jgi:hypothetical protein
LGNDSAAAAITQSAIQPRKVGNGGRIKEEA